MSMHSTCVELARRLPSVPKNLMFVKMQLEPYRSWFKFSEVKRIIYLFPQLFQLCLLPSVHSEAGLDDTSHEVAFWMLFCYGVLSAVLQVCQYFKNRKAKRISRENEEDDIFFKNYSSGSTKASSHATPSDFSRDSTKTNDVKNPGAPTSSILRSGKPGLKEASESGFWTSVSGYLWLKNM